MEQFPISDIKNVYSFFLALLKFYSKIFYSKKIYKQNTEEQGIHSFTLLSRQELLLTFSATKASASPFNSVLVVRYKKITACRT